MSLFVREFECPSCGAPVRQNHANTKVLACTYCGQTSFLNAENLEAAGEKNLLIDYGSVLSVGKYGKIKGREFMVLGRLRIDYDDGFFDEWYVLFTDDGSTGWIQEDDGSFVYFKQEKELKNPIHLSDIGVGTWTDLNEEWMPIFVTSKSKAAVNGGEGELPFRVIPGDPANFIDGISEGKIISIELLPNENVLYKGTPFQIEDLTISA